MLNINKIKQLTKLGKQKRLKWTENLTEQTIKDIEKDIKKIAKMGDTQKIYDLPISLQYEKGRFIADYFKKIGFNTFYDDRFNYVAIRWDDDSIRD